MTYDLSGCAGPEFEPIVGIPGRSYRSRAFHTKDPQRRGKIVGEGKLKKIKSGSLRFCFMSLSELPRWTQHADPGNMQKFYENH